MARAHSIAWFEQMIRSLGRWLAAYGDDVCHYSMHDTSSKYFNTSELVEYKGMRTLVGAWYIVIARRVE